VAGHQQSGSTAEAADKKLPPDVVKAAEVIDQRFRCDADGYISVEPTADSIDFKIVGAA
jgi:hypothetical protein